MTQGKVGQPPPLRQNPTWKTLPGAARGIPSRSSAHRCPAWLKPIHGRDLTASPGCRGLFVPWAITGSLHTDGWECALILDNSKARTNMPYSWTELQAAGS